MKNDSTTDILSFKAAIKTVSKAARRKAFRKGLPVAISKNGKVVFVFKDKREVAATNISSIINVKKKNAITKIQVVCRP